MIAAFALAAVAGMHFSAPAAEIDEFRIKRQDVYKFSRKPTLTRRGEGFEISFTSKGYCDVSVAVEDEKGRIVRHLACGVLGENAPPPFKKGSLAQTVVWDGKNDKGEYVDDLDVLRIRVSLGLKPRFEKNLYWSPKRRAGGLPPVVAACKKGVVVYDGGEALDHVRLFDHDGNYLRTLLPFPADRVEKTKGLSWHTSPLGEKWPVKPNFLQNTFMTIGANMGGAYSYKNGKYGGQPSKGMAHFGMGGRGSATLAVDKDGRIAAVNWAVNRLATDGTTGGLEFRGPGTSVKVRRGGPGWRGGGRMIQVAPLSAAFSPDGEWVYLAGYSWDEHWDTAGKRRRWLHGVSRVKFDGSEPATVFAGSLDQKKPGTANGQFRVAASVACDKDGNVYVADHANDRVQIFKPDGTHSRNIKVARPAYVGIHHASKELYVGSWFLANQFSDGKKGKKVHATVTRLGPLSNPREIASYALPLHGYRGTPHSWDAVGGTQYRLALDEFASKPTLWLVPGSQPRRPAHARSQGPLKQVWAQVGIRLLQIDGKKLVEKRDFGAEAAKAAYNLRPVHNTRQRLYVNPKTGKLYVGEPQYEDGTGSGKAFQSLLVIDPESEKMKFKPMPFDAEEICFDIDGNIYLRDRRFVVRFDPRTWREIPWDYGEEHNSVGFASGRAGKRWKGMVSGLVFGGSLNWHMGGMGVNARGDLAISSYVSGNLQKRTDAKKVSSDKGYQPRIYPGRVVGGKRALVHVWDRHGQLIHEDAAPGLPDCYSLGIDANRDLYVLSSGTRILDGKRYYNDMTGTVVKFRPGKGRLVASGKTPVPITDGGRPEGQPDVVCAMQGSAWALGVEWLYGGVGYCGKNRGVGCACFNTRSCLDYFARTFAPEIDRYSVAVLDSNGNLILRVGRYGNVDDGRPLARGKNPPKKYEPKSLGSDEVSLFHGAYVASHTDHRLFISDLGNGRVVSVKLDYHKTEALKLKGKVVAKD